MAYNFPIHKYNSSSVPVSGESIYKAPNYVKNNYPYNQTQNIITYPAPVNYNKANEYNYGYSNNDINFLNNTGASSDYNQYDITAYDPLNYQHQNYSSNNNTQFNLQNYQNLNYNDNYSYLFPTNQHPVKNYPPKTTYPRKNNNQIFANVNKITGLRKTMPTTQKKLTQYNFNAFNFTEIPANNSSSFDLEQYLRNTNYNTNVNNAQTFSQPVNINYDNYFTNSSSAGTYIMNDNSKDKTKYEYYEKYLNINNNANNVNANYDLYTNNYNSNEYSSYIEGFSSKQDNQVQINQNNITESQLQTATNIGYNTANAIIPTNNNYNTTQTEYKDIEVFSSKPDNQVQTNQDNITEGQPQTATNTYNNTVNTTITTNNNYNTNDTNNYQNITRPFILPNDYIFFKIGLHNIGSTCYMNATLQCLLHVSPLASYFLNIYPKDFKSLQNFNESAVTKGKISYAFYGIIKSIKEASIQLKKNSNLFNPKTSINSLSSVSSGAFNKAVSPEIFQKTVGAYNPQFRNLEANDSKDLTLYLLQTMHQELNYFSKNKPYTGYPNQYNRPQTFMVFVHSYDVVNCSIISDLFYGTSENTTKCENCKNVLYNFQKFEFLSFGVCNYDKKPFSIYNGFDDYTRTDKLAGDNQYYCNYCKKLCDAEINAKILMAPKYLIINIDYGKNKKYMPSAIKYEDEIDITKYMSFNNQQIKYRILGICSHFGYSGNFGHYVAYCRNKQDSNWYKFNDSIVTPCRREEINSGGTPYLLLYEQINSMVI